MVRVMFCLALLLSCGQRASAISFSETLTAVGVNDANGIQFAPDRIQLFLTPGGNTTFSTLAPSVLFPEAGGWTYSTSNSDYNAVLERTGPFSSPPPFPATQWSQGFEQTFSQSFSVSWTLYALNWSTPDANDFIYRDTGGGTVVAAPPVAPEPSTLLILGLGAAGAAFQARRRKTAAPVAAPA